MSTQPNDPDAPATVTPPVVVDELRELLRLTLVPGVGPATLETLLQTFGSAARVTRASLRDLCNVHGVGRKTAESIVDARAEIDPAIELALCAQRGVCLVPRSGDEYPQMLKQIHDPPHLLYCKGSFDPADDVSVALVGSRRSTPYGQRIAEKLAASLARAGITVVSGLARGVDAAAHRGALKAGGRTIAVCANGLEQVYPPEHEGLGGQIAASGALISEMPMRQEPLAGLFPQRNRLIAGLCVGVVVVEAAPRSGSLITAQHAMEQNREVFAVPGPVESLASRGCHQLIRDGAKLVETVDDILEELREDIRRRLPVVSEDNSPTTAGAAPVKRALSEQESNVLAHLDDVPKAADQLIGLTGLAASQVMATLSVLEVRRLIRRMPGNHFVRL